MTDPRMKLNDTEREMFVGALNVAVQLAMNPSPSGKDLGKIIAGLCAIINKVAQIDDPTEPIGRAAD